MEPGSGDFRGWRKRKSGHQLSEPLLAEWCRKQMTGDAVLLNTDDRKTVELACRQHCDHRKWHLYAVNATTNHVHVVAAADLSPQKGVLGLIWSATTGSFFLAITAMYVWMFRSYHDPIGLASIVGGLSGFFCFPLFIPLTLPMGIAGAWLAVKIYLRMDTALPMVLFNQLREEQRQEKLDRR